jgi:hypothetical protein
MNCSHSIDTSHYIPPHTDDWGYDVAGRWEYGTKNTYEDMDTHRYRCTRCKEVFYYSNRAKEYYEQGIQHEGLFIK